MWHARRASHRPLLQVNMTCLADKLRGAGYATHAVGKWDVGMATERECSYAAPYRAARR